mmetsp:Transcript_24866/g.63456  ORF Transcript_24866/g.63456 Transcript_24866/m.63456 type:complete len:237 (+) Transcript_24866:538-1248(+)
MDLQDGQRRHKHPHHVQNGRQGDVPARWLETGRQLSPDFRILQYPDEPQHHANHELASFGRLGKDQHQPRDCPYVPSGLDVERHLDPLVNPIRSHQNILVVRDQSNRKSGRLQPGHAVGDVQEEAHRRYARGQDNKQRRVHEGSHAIPFQRVPQRAQERRDMHCSEEIGCEQEVPQVPRPVTGVGGVQQVREQAHLLLACRLQEGPVQVVPPDRRVEQHRKHGCLADPPQVHQAET